MIPWRSLGPWCLGGALFCVLAGPAAAELAHAGFTGLITTPTAEVLPDGQFDAQFTWLDGPNTYLMAPKTNRLYIFSVGALPGLEATLRFNQVIGWVDPDAPGVAWAFDRMFSAKYRLPLPERWPHVAVGLYDMISAGYLSGIVGSTWNGTLFGQTTPYVVMGQDRGAWSWNAGYGVSQSFINGPFAGLDYRPWKPLSLMAEYDSHRVNLGVTLSLGPLHLKVSRIGFDTWAIGANLLIGL